MKFKSKYRIESARLRSWNYASSGWYFVTVCTKQLKPYFGNIDQAVTNMNDLGRTANQYWFDIPKHHEYTAIDEFVVMPNHIHGIIAIAETLDIDASRVETLHATSLRSPTRSSISPRKGSLGVIIRSYKSAVTRWARMNGYPNFAWQPRFFDHIIRNEDALSRIRTYIQNNPQKWEFDKYYR